MSDKITLGDIEDRVNASMCMTYGSQHPEGREEARISKEDWVALLAMLRPAPDEFAQRAYEEYVADIHLDDAGIEAEDIGRKLMRPFLDWMVASAERKVPTKIFVVAFAHFAGWMSYMVNRSTRTDDEFMNGLENLTGLIHNEAVAITSAEERDTNFVIEDLIAEGELKNIDPTAGVPVPPKGKLN